ncbi:MAG: hypothetical protein K6E98_07630, partial [Lachnospiraceae bacterium]|nr:hypothetical protein [Lachnospiraceae bacterium]
MENNRKEDSNKKTVKYSAINWDEYKVGRDGNKDINAPEGLIKDSKLTEKGNFRPGAPIDDKDDFDDRFFKELKDVFSDENQERNSGKGKKKKKSVNEKLKEINIARELKESEKTLLSSGENFEDLEKNIIKTTEKEQDSILENAAQEVSKALAENDDSIFLAGVRDTGTFEIPKLDIHFGDTSELVNIRESIEAADLAKLIDDDALSAKIESTTVEELVKQAEEALVVTPIKTSDKREIKESEKISEVKESEQIPEAKEPEKIQKPKKSDRVWQIKESEKISEVKESEQIPEAKEPEKIQKPKKSDRVRQVKESEKISEVK